jgi:hypothetical protein
MNEEYFDKFPSNQENTTNVMDYWTKFMRRIVDQTELTQLEKGEKITKKIIETELQWLKIV